MFLFLLIFYHNPYNVHSRLLIGIDFLYSEKFHFLTNILFLESTKIMFLILTSKRMKLHSCTKSTIVENLLAFLNLIWFLKIG